MPPPQAPRAGDMGGDPLHLCAANDQILCNVRASAARMAAPARALKPGQPGRISSRRGAREFQEGGPREDP
eukprot:15304534-Alexandrium_andersonii.AAC.1